MCELRQKGFYEIQSQVLKAVVLSSCSTEAVIQNAIAGAWVSLLTVYPCISRSMALWPMAHFGLGPVMIITE